MAEHPTLRKVVGNFLESRKDSDRDKRQQASTDLIYELLAAPTIVGLVAILTLSLLFWQNMLTRQQNEEIRKAEYTQQLLEATPLLYEGNLAIKDGAGSYKDVKGITIKEGAIREKEEQIMWPTHSAVTRGQAAKIVVRLLRKLEFEVIDLNKGLFQEARMENIDLDGAKLQEASFFGAYLKNATFRGADLTGANLRKADLVGADFTGAIFVVKDKKSDKKPTIVFRSAAIQGAIFTGTDLKDIELTDAGYDDDTVWPDDFSVEDAIAAGAVKRELKK